MSGTNQGLSPDDIVSVTISLTAQAVVGAGLNCLLIIGTTLGVIPLSQRLLTFTGSTILEQVEDLYGTQAQEYLAALDYCSQSPQPQQLQIGLWNAAGTPGVLQGGQLTPTQQMLSNFTGIADGAITVNLGAGPTATNISGINFTNVTSMEGVAEAFNTAASASGDPIMSWNAGLNSFELTTSTQGAGAIIDWCTAGTGTGMTDISGLLQLTTSAQANGGTLTEGVAAETPQAAINVLRQYSAKWYCAHFAVANGAAGSSFLTNAAEVEGVAQAIQAFGTPTIFGFTSQDPNVLVVTSTTDIPYLLSKLSLYRTFTEYCSTDPYAGCSLFGREATVDYTGANTAITLKFKTLPGIAPELLTEIQAATLTAKNCNVYATYSDGIAIVQQGCMSDGTWMDDIQNIDWVATTVQAALINQLITTATKVPQTDAGMHQLLTAVDAVMAQGVTNGVIGEGLTWQGGNIGLITTGTVLPSGWYIYQPSINAQPVGDRILRQAPLMTICFNFAGAVHSASVALNVVR
jgi:hypothetical protein